MKTINELAELQPCHNGLEWARKQPSLKEAWNTCEKSDWMWWLASNLQVPKEISVKYANFCANTIAHLKHAAADAADRAANAAANAANAANAASAADAADAAANASYTAANAAANAAADAAAYADAYADATYAAAYTAARKQQADFIRTIFPNPFE